MPWVTGFPFNTFPHPQYVGATLTCLGGALDAGTYAGIAFTIACALSYVVAVQIEQNIFGDIERAKKAARRRVAQQA